MGSDYGRRRNGLTNRVNSCKTVFVVGVLPFCLGLVIILTLFRHRQDASVDLAAAAAVQQGAAPCPPVIVPDCNCTNVTAESERLVELAAKLSQESVHSVLSAANSSDPGDQTVRVNSVTLPSVFLFVGILSGRGYRHRRLAVREAWANSAQGQGESVCRFILSEDESTPQVQKEVETHQDIIFLKEKTNYKSILYKTYFVLEYAVATYDVKFILKTDDDAFINIKALIWQLRLLCETPGCRSERVYMGKMAKESEVLLQPGHKWNNMVFHNHTGDYQTVCTARCTDSLCTPGLSHCKSNKQSGNCSATIDDLHCCERAQTGAATTYF